MDILDDEELPTVNQTTPALLALALLQSKGIITEREANTCTSALFQIPILSLPAARHLVHDLLEQLDSWDTCEVCRRVMHGWQESLTNHHAAGHPILDSTEKQ